MLLFFIFTLLNDIYVLHIDITNQSIYITNKLKLLALETWSDDLLVPGEYSRLLHCFNA